MKRKSKFLSSIILSAILAVVFIPTTAFGLEESDGWGVVPGGDVEAIAVNDAKDAYLSTSADIITYKFTAAEEGHYVFYSSGELNTMGIVFDTGETYLPSNEGCDGDNFSIGFYACVGETYYLQAALDDSVDYNADNVGSLKLNLVKSVLNTDAKITYTHKYVYTGKNIVPNIKITYNGKTLIKNQDYILYYWIKDVGEGQFCITGSSKYPGDVWGDCTVIPQKSAVAKMVSGKNKLSVTMKSKVSKTGGNTYQIAYKQKGAASWKYTSTKSQTKTISSLKKGKQYQIKVRAYKKVYGTPYYGAWSSVKTSYKIK